MTRAADDGVYHLARLDADGGIVWQKSFRHAEKSYIISVFPREDGGYIMQGYFSGRSSRQTWIIRLDAEGGLVWSRSYDAGTGMKARRAAGDGGDILISSAYGLLRLDANGLLTAAWPVSKPDYLLCGVPAVDGGYYLGGGGGIAKTDASGWVSKLLPDFRCRYRFEPGDVAGRKRLFHELIHQRGYRRPSLYAEASGRSLVRRLP